MLVRMKTIPLNKGKHTLVDDDTYEWISQWKWFCSSAGYAFRNERYGEGRRRTIFMHREIMKTPKGMCTDHINHDVLDNQKDNLRICTKRQNNFHRLRKSPKVDTPYRGVYFRYGSRYHARIKVKGKALFLGSFDRSEDAARCYNLAAKQHFGEFAVLNDIAA